MASGSDPLSSSASIRRSSSEASTSSGAPDTSSTRTSDDRVSLAYRLPSSQGNEVAADGRRVPLIPDPSSPPASLSAVKSSSSSKSCQSPKASPVSRRRVREHSFGNQQSLPTMDQSDGRACLPPRSPSGGSRKMLLHDTLAKAKARDAQRVNDAMVYLDGPQVYTCAQCRTHLTSHDDIISKSFHGRHGRAYLFDQCVNVTMGTAEERRLITGLHSVSDIFCKRCKTLVGWTYRKAYEASQKYKEGKYIIEKINLHLEESDYYDVAHPAGEKTDRWRKRSMSWGENDSVADGSSSSMIFEYRPSSP